MGFVGQCSALQQTSKHPLRGNSKPSYIKLASLYLQMKLDDQGMPRQLLLLGLKDVDGSKAVIFCPQDFDTAKTSPPA